MSEQTKQALETFVQKILSLAESSTDFAVEQIPLVVQEWLTWMAVEHAMWVVFQLSIPVAAYLLVGKVGRIIYEEEDETKDAEILAITRVIRIVAAAVLGTMFGLAAMWNLTVVVKVWLAPRVVVLEKFADLVR